MGKLVLIGLILIVAILSTMMVSVRGRSNASVDDLALRTTIQESNLLANYARQYGIRLLNDRTQTPNKAELEANAVYKKTFSTAFTVKDGAIDSLLYSNDTSNNIILDAFVTYRANDNVVNTIARAVLTYPPLDSVRLGNIENAVSSKGPIEIAGKATGSKGIHGDVLSEDEILYHNPTSEIDGNEVIDTFPTFEQIFGTTIDSMRAIADYVGNDPDVFDGIIFLSGEEEYIFNNSYTASGSGILVVEGDLTINGEIDWQGVIWITGQLNGLGNSHIVGAIFAEGVNLSETGGSMLVEYDLDLSGSTITNREGKGNFRILAIYDDYRN
ncbi:hypothetical protein ACFLYK_02350 [Candidatus Cloacimonadota bacterium]